MSFGNGRPSLRVEGEGTADAGRVTVVVGSSVEKDVRVLRGLMFAASASRVMSTVEKKSGSGRRDRMVRGMGSLSERVVLRVKACIGCKREPVGRRVYERVERFGYESSGGVTRFQILFADLHSLNRGSNAGFKLRYDSPQA